MKVATQFVVEPMRVEHIPAVSVIEKLSFPQPWPQNAYKREIQENRMATYIVAKQYGSSAPLADVEAVPKLEQYDGLFERLARFLRNGQDTPPPPEIDEDRRSVVGYAGIWMMADEAHVTTIASHPSVRGKGVGELLLLGLIDRALALGARWMTLEVRVSNLVAQNLYTKYTFKEMGVRRRYYSDNGEDALVMWTDALDADSFREALARNERRLGERLGGEIRLGGQVHVVGHG